MDISFFTRCFIKNSSLFQIEFIILFIHGRNIIYKEEKKKQPLQRLIPDFATAFNSTPLIEREREREILNKSKYFYYFILQVHLERVTKATFYFNTVT
jgi:hypothetical protein